MLALVMLSALMPLLASATIDPTSHVSISASPSELSQEGDVTVALTLVNTNTAVPIVTADPNNPDETPIPQNDGSYSGISITNTFGVAFGTSGVSISAGGSYTFTGTMHVTTTMIGTELPFTVSWYDNGSVHSETVNVIISHADTAYLRVTRTASPASASPGTVINFRYTFVNTGSMKLEEITLVDRYVFGSSTTSTLDPFSLDPGQTYVFDYQLYMGSSTIVSTPVVTFRAEGSSTDLVVNVSSLTIGLINSQVSKEVIRGESTPQGVSFTLYITNNGNQRLTGLSVRDELGNSYVSDVFSLAVGETKVVEAFIPNPTSVRYVVFKISGYDYTGTTFSDNTESFIVRPYIDVSLLDMTFIPKVMSALTDDNMIKVEFTLNNTGSLSWYDLSLSESEIEYSLHSWNELPAGESAVIELDVPAGGERELTFVLTAKDSSGNEYSYAAYVTASHSGGADIVPVITDPSQNGSSVTVIDDGINTKIENLTTATGKRLVSWFKILGVVTIIVGVVLLALGGTELYLYLSKKKRSAR